MGLIQRIRETFQRDAVLARMIPLWKQGQKIHGPHDFEEFAKEAIRGNPIVYACVDELCSSVSETPLLAERLNREEEWEPDTKVQPAIDVPNREQTQEEWLHEWMMHVLWAGISFQQVIRSNMRLPREFWALKPHRVKIVPGADGHVNHLVYSVGGVEQPPIPVEDVIIDRSVDPLDDYWGLSPVHVAALTIDLDNESVKYLTDFFLNAGQPAHVLKLKERVEKAERERVKARWREEYGRGGFHGLAVLDADAEVQELGSRPDKLGLVDIFSTTESRICSIFGVHPAIIATRLGLERSTLTNFPQAERSFQLRTVEQYRRRIEEKLTRFFRRELARTDLRIRFDRSVVPALQKDMEPQRVFAVNAWKEGLITRNQALEIAGLDPVEGEEGDEYKSAPQPPEPGDGGDDDDEDQGDQEEERRPIAPRTSRNGQHAPVPVGTVAEPTAGPIGPHWTVYGAPWDVMTRAADLERYARAVDETARSWEDRFLEEAERLFDAERLAVQRALRDQLARHQNDDLAHRILLVIGNALNGHREVWAQGMLPLFSGLLEDQAQHWAAQFGMSFSLDNPEVQRFLRSYSFRFAERLGKTSEETLRGIVSQGIQDGKSVTSIRRDITAAYQTFGPNRADMIARTECLPPETPVDGAVVDAVHRRWYDGPMIEIVTSRGRKLSATPNHPMLTGRGWLGAGEIAVGDDLVCDRRGQSAGAPGYQDVQAPPSTISQIFDAVAAVGIRERVIGSKPDFHGDGMEGEVDILRPYRRLRIGRFAPLYEPTVKQFLSQADMIRSPVCPGCRRLLSVDKQPCLCGGAGPDARLAQPLIYQASAHAQGVRYDSGRLAVQVAGHHHIGTDGVLVVPRQAPLCKAIPRGLVERPEHVSFPKDAGYPLRVGSHLLGDGGDAASGLIEMDRVVSVSVRRYVGHVYNLSTPYGYFTTNGGAFTGNTIRASNKGALETFQAAGIQRMRWLATPDGRICPFCNSLDGREFAVGTTILGLGERLTLDDGQSLTNTYEDVDAPPVHVRCRCTVIPILED